MFKQNVVHECRGGQIKKKSINIISHPQINKKNEKSFDKVQQQLKIKTPKKIKIEDH